MTLDNPRTKTPPGNRRQGATQKISCVAAPASLLDRANLSSVPIAALYVEAGGCYFGLAGVEPWDEARDARQYAGPHPVVAHPPCARWGRYAETHATLGRIGQLGDDGGCFAAALAAVRRWGGVLEHPATSRAWPAFGLPCPSHDGGWQADLWGGLSCYVEQANYGHAALKPSFLYVAGLEPPPLIAGRPQGDFRPLENLSKRQRAATPPAFRDLLIGIARSARP